MKKEAYRSQQYGLPCGLVPYNTCTAKGLKQEVMHRKGQSKKVVWICQTANAKQATKSGSGSEHRPLIDSSRNVWEEQCADFGGQR